MNLPVLYLTINPNRASTTAPTEGWFRCLRPQGLVPVLVSHKAGAFHAWASEQGVAAYEIPLPFPSKTWPWPFFRSLARLLLLVRRHRIRIIHCNEQDVYPIGQYLGRLCRLPVVVSIHFGMKRDFCRWAFSGARMPRRIFFVSRSSLETCRPGVEDIIPESRWRVLPNGLDPEQYRPDEVLRSKFRFTHGLGSAFVLGTACFLREVKQLEHLFDAVARLSIPQVRLLIAGGPDLRQRDYAENLMREGKQKLGDRLEFLGHLDDMRGFYNALDLYVNTSKEEACSISILEAMACGCPVVGYPSKSIDEQVLPDGGEIVEQDRVDLLAEAVSRWFHAPEKLAAARIAARRRVEENYDIHRVAEQLWREYEELIGR